MTYTEAPDNRPKAKNRPRAYKSFEARIFQRWVNTQWLGYLTKSEAVILNFICARTLSWNKQWELIPHRHFIDGVPGHFAGCNMVRNTLRVHLRKLIEDGFVLERRYRNTTQYAVNVMAMGTPDDPAMPRILAKEEHLERAKTFRIEKAKVVRMITREYARTRCADVLETLERIKREHTPKRGQKLTPKQVSITPTGKPSGAHPSDAYAQLRECPNNDIPQQCSNEDKPDMFERRPKKKSTGRKQPRYHDRYADNIGYKEAERALRPSQPQTARAAGHQAKAILERAQNDAAKRKPKNPNSRTAMVKVWNETTVSIYGDWALPTVTDLKKLTHVTSVPIAHKDVSWSDIVAWYVGDYAQALAFAVPFMVQREAQRNDLLNGAPSLTLFVKFRAKFAEAYVTAFYGEGMSTAQGVLAEELDEHHQRATERRARLAAGEELDATIMTGQELIDQARGTGRARREIRNLDVFDQIENELAQDNVHRRTSRRAQEHARNELIRNDVQEAMEETAQATQDDMYESIRAEMGADLTDEECAQIAQDMFGE